VPATPIAIASACETNGCVFVQPNVHAAAHAIATPIATAYATRLRRSKKRFVSFAGITAAMDLSSIGLREGCVVQHVHLISGRVVSQGMQSSPGYFQGSPVFANASCTDQGLSGDRRRPC
jgi:hypothetical protein